ncbi:MAG: hypothetical protein CFE26_15085, partial [Verrucomicrobiales bacterium VVV1]
MPLATIDHFPFTRFPDADMSKRIFQHPEVPAGETTVSWRTVGQLEDTPSFRAWLTREFPRGAAEMTGDEDMETS